MIKAVLFDHGGVLTEGGKAGAIRQIFARAYNMDPEKLRLEDEGLSALKGTMSDAAFIDSMNQRHGGGSPVTLQHLEATVDHLAPCPPIYDLASALRTHGIKTGILSNTLCITADSLRSRGLYDNFKPILLSCDTHMAKPETAFYKLALERLGLPANEVLFIDDQDVFLAPARQLGMHTILAVSPQQIVADVKALFIKENNLTLE